MVHSIQKNQTKGKVKGIHKVGRKIFEYDEAWEQDELDMNMEFLDERLHEMKKFKPETTYWRGDVKNFGWRSLSGQKYFVANNIQEIFNEVLPNTANHPVVFNWGKGIAIQNFHHDSPTGREWYYIKPVSEKEYREVMG